MNTISERFRTIQAWVLRTVRRVLSLRRARTIWLYLLRITERMEDNHIFLSAGAIAFNTLLCFIPLILIVCYILGLYLDSESSVRTIDTYIDSLQLFPYEREVLRSNLLSLITEFVSGSHLAGLIGLLGLVWTSSALFATLRTVLNQIFNVKDTKNIVISKIKDLSLLSLVGIGLILITILLYGFTIVEGAGAGIFGQSNEKWAFHGIFSHATSSIISFAILLVLFRLIPDRRLPFRIIMLMSGIAAMSWAVAKVAFAYYLIHLWSIGRIYGSYAVLIATALWVYYSSITLLIASEIGEMAMERAGLKRFFRETEMRKYSDSIHAPRLTFSTKNPKAS